MTEVKWPAGRYRLQDKAYLPTFPGAEPQLLESGTEIVHDGKPGLTMEPLDDGAKQAKEMAAAIIQRKNERLNETRNAMMETAKAMAIPNEDVDDAQLLAEAGVAQKRKPGRPPGSGNSIKDE